MEDSDKLVGILAVLDAVLAQIEILHATNRRLEEKLRVIHSEQLSNYQAYVGWTTEALSRSK